MFICARKIKPFLILLFTNTPKDYNWKHVFKVMNILNDTLCDFFYWMIAAHTFIPSARHGNAL